MLIAVQTKTIGNNGYMILKLSREKPLEGNKAALIRQIKIDKSKLPRKCTNLVITIVQVTTNAILALIDEARSLDRRGLWADSTLAGCGANLCA